jgi:TonB family protein
MKSCVAVLLMILSSFVFAQNESDQSLEYYNAGINLLQQKKFREADSLLTLSADLFPHPDTYYNLALAEYYSGNFCGYCDCMERASRFVDIEADNLFNSKCVKHDTIKYTNEFDKDSTLYSVKITYKCSDEKDHFFYKCDIKTNKKVWYYLQEEDTLGEKIDIYKSFPDFKKIYANRKKIIAQETMPQYPGGDEARIKVLTDNIKYPQQAKENGIQGTVWVSFFVTKTGKVRYVNLVEGIGGGCDEESVRVVKLMPDWIPATYNGTPRGCFFNMPIRFTLN